jgi:Holliday junction resolvase RusA-like endonuclease
MTSQEEGGASELSGVVIRKNKDGQYEWEFSCGESYSRVKFVVPGLPESMNSLYKFNTLTRTMYISREAREYKNDVKRFMPPCKFNTSRFHITIDLRGNWFYKNGKVKRADIQNLTKLLIDSIFEKLGLDDSSVWSMLVTKTQADREETHVELISYGI